MELKKVASLLLPEGLIERFDIIRITELGNIKSKKVDYHIWLDEKNAPPEGAINYESKGYYPEKQIQDFPIRGKGVYLRIRRRRWRDKEGKRSDIKSSFKFEAQGVKLTEELATFLKE